jgi:hypothetical protein
VVDLFQGQLRSTLVSKLPRSLLLMSHRLPLTTLPVCVRRCLLTTGHQVCPRCARVSVSFDPMMYLSAPIPLPEHKQVSCICHVYEPQPRSKRCVCSTALIFLAPSDVQVAVDIKRGSLFQDLVKKLCKKLKLPADSLQGCDVARGRMYALPVLPSAPNHFRCILLPLQLPRLALAALLIVSLLSQL